MAANEVAAGFDPGQPRDPGGEGGGRWVKAIGDGQVAPLGTERIPGFPTGMFTPDDSVKFWPERMGSYSGFRQDAPYGPFWKAVATGQGDELAFWFTSSEGKPHHDDMYLALFEDHIPPGHELLSGYGMTTDRARTRVSVAPVLARDVELTVAERVVRRHRRDIRDANAMLDPRQQDDRLVAAAEEPAAALSRAAWAATEYVVATLEEPLAREYQAVLVAAGDDAAQAFQVESIAAGAYREEEHPRDPGGEGGGQWIPKETLSAAQRIYVAEGALERGGMTGRTFSTEHRHRDDPAHQAFEQVLTDYARAVAGTDDLRVLATEWIDGPLGTASGSWDRLQRVIKVRNTTNELTILHEVAHAVTDTPEGIEGHTPEFIDAAEALYRRHLGDEAADSFARLARPPLRAAGPPRERAEVGHLVDQDQMEREAALRTRRMRQLAVALVADAALESVGVSFDVAPGLAASVIDKIGLRAEDMGAAARAAVSAAVTEGLAEGWSVPETAAAIRASVAEASPARAVMLARTDLVGLANASSMASARLVLGDDVYKRWWTAHDERVRPTHQAANGQTVRIGEKFKVGDAELDFPGDQDGPDEEVIQCRCVPLYVSAKDGPSPVVTAAAWESTDPFLGDLIEAVMKPIEDPDSAPASTGYPLTAEMARALRDPRVVASALIPTLRAGAVDFTDGWMVALYPSPEEASAIAREGGQPAESLHVTLAFFPEPPDVIETLVALMEVAGRWEPLAGKVGGVGRFAESDKGTPVIALPSVDGMNELRADVARSLDAVGSVYSRDHGWVPHMTLSYEEGEIPDYGVVVGSEVTFTHLCFVMGPEEIRLPLRRILQAAAYVETQHPRHPAGSDRGGEWRAKGPTVNERHVAASIEKWVTDTAEWRDSKGEILDLAELERDRQFLWSRYHEVYDGPLGQLQDRLAGFSDVTIQPDIADQAQWLMDPDADDMVAAFNIALPVNSTGSKPDVTVWVTRRDGIEIADVLDVTDTDFFDSTGASLRYSNMLDAIRGIKRTGTVTLYRGMSAAEAAAWDAGSEIPHGKFFTSRPSAAQAMDISGEFPELHVFDVSAEDVIETDPGVYQTVRPTRKAPDGTLRAAAAMTASFVQPLTAAYDESKHPRNPSGKRDRVESPSDGGKFRSRVGATPFRPEDTAEGFRETGKWRAFLLHMRASAERLGVTIDSETDVDGYWQGDEEPSLAIDAHDGPDAMSAWAEGVRGRWDQDAVLIFDQESGGDDTMVTIPALPHEARFALRAVGIDGATIYPDRVVVMGVEANRVAALIDELGVDLVDAEFRRGTLRFAERL